MRCWFILVSWTLLGFWINRVGATTAIPVYQVTPPSAASLAVTPPHYAAAWNATRSRTSAEEHYHVIRGSSHETDSVSGSSSEQQRERELFHPQGNHLPSPDLHENELIEQPKPQYPPVPGVGYIPPAVEHTAPLSLGFQHEREVPRVEYVTADCFSNYMKITVQFNGSFEGLVYSTGYAHDSDCVYVNGSGVERYEFSIRLNRCGTLGRPEFEPSSNEVPDRNHFMWNTITVQYNPEIEEDWDEHFQVTCEYGYEFRRTVTFPVVGVEKNTASPYLVTLSPPQCYMEVRAGFGPSGSRLTGPVTVGDPLTLMIHMESDSTEFDVAVSSCYAHNGAKKKLQLIDANGCILKEQLMSPFRGVRNAGGANHVALYAYFKAFRFTSSPALYLECDVHMCHGTCPAQRCHWKSLTKRSVSEVDNSSLTSENVQLFQALQVLQESSDNLASGKVKADDVPGNTLCLPVLALSAATTAFLACLLLSALLCVLLCLRMRRMKEVGSDLNPYLTTTFVHGQPARKRL
ncbi:ZP domain-containing protein [Nephila pilipes]|uniref:ZP domain-containing protein n=1 Tax=Nephila pilipes TaxID=299642 RepID=A0A8X6MSC0_NEPPI|nr:ZP domain-containing protein [Nephila pilipes]